VSHAGFTGPLVSGTIIGNMSNRILVTCGVIAAAAVGMLFRSRRRDGASLSGSAESEPAGGMLAAIDVDDDEQAEIISRARPALERAAKLI
jgi:hypothetical protein